MIPAASRPTSPGTACPRTSPTSSRGTTCAEPLTGGGLDPPERARLREQPEEWVVCLGDDAGKIVLIEPRRLRPGRTVVLRLGEDRNSVGLGWTVVDAPAPRCDVVAVEAPAPQAVPGG